MSRTLLYQSTPQVLAAKMVCLYYKIIDVTTLDRTVVAQCYDLCRVNVSCHVNVSQNNWFAWRNAVKPLVLTGYLFGWFACTKWLIRMCVTGLMHVCDMTHSCVWHDSFIWVTWLIHMCAMTHSCVWHGSFMCATWLIHVCEMIHSNYV